MIKPLEGWVRLSQRNILQSKRLKYIFWSAFAWVRNNIDEIFSPESVMVEYMQQIRALQRKRSLVTIFLQNVYNAVNKDAVTRRERGVKFYTVYLNNLTTTFIIVTYLSSFWSSETFSASSGASTLSLISSSDICAVSFLCSKLRVFTAF